MDPKRKKLYIILIIACVVISIGVFLWGRGGSTPATPEANAPSPLNTTGNAAGLGPVLKPDGTYSAPAVFPESTKLDTSVLNLGTFTLLKVYPPATVSAGELGRDDPFKNY
ncbi:MAG: hypothetical protein WDN47_04410 [Candidatus Doudnabacteria bacterium]